MKISVKDLINTLSKYYDSNPKYLIGEFDTLTIKYSKSSTIIDDSDSIFKDIPGIREYRENYLKSPLVLYTVDSNLTNIVWDIKDELNDRFKSMPYDYVYENYICTIHNITMLEVLKLKYSSNIIDENYIIDSVAHGLFPGRKLYEDDRSSRNIYLMLHVYISKIIPWVNDFVNYIK